MNGHALLDLARAIATVVHDGQSRKGAGEPYINHPSRVAAEVWGWRAKSLAWLHDTIEDAPDPWEMECTLRIFFPADIVDDLLLLSRLHDPQGVKERYQDWIGRIVASGRKDVIAVKLADVNDNLADIRDIPNAEGMEARYLKAKAQLLQPKEDD